MDPLLIAPDQNQTRQSGDALGYRQLPQNEEAEQALLGAMLIDNSAYDQVSTFLEPDHFFLPVHGRIYEAARALISRGQIANPVTLKSYFDADESLADIGGAQYLARLAGAAVSIINAEDYGRVIRDLVLCAAGIDPLRERLDVPLGDRLAVFPAQQILEEHLQ